MNYKLNEIKIEVTHDCPLACVHCSSDAHPNCNRQISFSKCQEIINSSIQLGVTKIAFSGGEPLLWPYLDDLCKSIKKNIEITIYTSGNIDNFQKKIENLIENGLKKIIFSLFGNTSNIHEHITRIHGSYQKTIESIRISNELGLNTELHFVALTRNYKYLNELAILSKKIGIKKISVLRFVPQGRGALLANDQLNKRQLIELKGIILNLRQNGINIRTGSPFNILFLNDNPSCLSGIDRIIVGPSLDIYPCDAFKQINAIDIVNTNEFSNLENFSLEKCWESSHYLNAIREYLSTSSIDPCNTCSKYNLCLSGCLAQKIIFYGKISKKPDPLCLLNRN